MRWGAVLALRALLAVVALPGAATVLVPWLLVRMGGAGAAPFAGRAFGTLLAAVGAIVVGWCVVDFARVGRGTLAPVDPPTVLVRRGLYRLVRNPMYVGVLTVLAGEALAFGSRVIALWALGLAAAFHVRVVRYEEPVLRATFGAAFDEYCRRVPRWLPGPWS
ncbi:MAG: isoprenylcysteine carboxylmethyltransferase family protein [Deltaproteobacteria bacterium]|nr:isoprenylcysteine carboxylmethyltransferase family protein [Deltaproteobacteria bacterium]